MILFSPQSIAPKKIHYEITKRHSKTIEDKMVTIKRYEKCGLVLIISRSLGICRTTALTIVHNKDNILAHIF